MFDEYGRRHKFEMQSAKEGHANCRRDGEENGMRLRSMQKSASGFVLLVCKQQADLS